MLTAEHLRSQEYRAVKNFSRSPAFKGWYISRSFGTKSALAWNFLKTPLEHQTPRRIANLSELCQSRALLAALDRAGLRAYGIGLDETVLLMAKNEPLAIGASVPIYQNWRQWSLKVTAAKYFDLSTDSIVDLSVTPPVADAARPSAYPAPVRPPVGGRFDLCGMVVGEGLKGAVELARKVSAFRNPVVISGETGTGKELIAKMIHDNSPRRNAGFLAINCAALPENLIESELFGHEKGAFTGAIALRQGLFELASGGTIFLDEIGEMPLLAQAKLLRVLDNGAFYRVGGNQQLKTQARVVAATNKNLEAEVQAGRFRQDLFYRLNVMDIHLPPLRARKQDILGLANHFLAGAVRRGGRNFSGFAPDAATALLAHDWPGNVRELQNCVERAVTLSGEETIASGDLDLKVKPAPVEVDPFIALARLALANGWGHKRTLKMLENPLLLAALEKAGGNKSRAAELLNVKRTTFTFMLQRHGLFDGEAE
jgi:transcriptional regulator with AAA-type ATPase domain